MSNSLQIFTRGWHFSDFTSVDYRARSGCKIQILSFLSFDFSQFDVKLTLEKLRTKLREKLRK
jgi:hypothetical protein